VNLRNFCHIAPDPQGLGSDGLSLEPNTIEKTFRALQYAALGLRGTLKKPDVICRLDSDTLFFPQNLLRIMACRNFSASQPWAIGHENYVHKHQMPGRVFLNGGTGICLSRAAVALLLDQMEKGQFHESQSPGDWNSGACITAPGHWDDVVLGACLSYLGVPISRWGTDCQGRSLFWPNTFESALPGPRQVRPRRLPPTTSFFQPPETQETSSSRSSDPLQDPDVANYHHWLYRAWQYLPCDHDNDTWLGDFPVGFHSYRNATEGRRIYRLFQRQKSLSGYSAHVWNGSLQSCESLLC
ncbi:unnamed protein product, partial [Polarella glacialis]